MIEELEQKFDEVESWLESQWYRRSDALRYEMDDLREQYEKVSQYKDRFTADEMKILAWCEIKLEQYENEIKE